MTRPLEKPSVFSTPISCCRSRTAMLMVLAVTSRMVNATARPMPFSRRRQISGHGNEAGAKGLLGFGLGLGIAVLKLGVDGLADATGVLGIVDHRRQPADADLLPGRLVEILVVEVHANSGRCRGYFDLVGVVDAVDHEIEGLSYS